MAKKIVYDDDLIDYLWEQSLDGAEMETGSNSEGPLWIGGMTLNGDDDQEIEDSGVAGYGEYSHVIITEDSNGFKRAELYNGREEYDAAFNEYDEEYGLRDDEDD
jgi:hypothetical protein